MLKYLTSEVFGDIRLVIQQVQVWLIVDDPSRASW